MLKNPHCYFELVFNLLLGQGVTKRLLHSLAEKEMAIVVQIIGEQPNIAICQVSQTKAFKTMYMYIL